MISSLIAGIALLGSGAASGSQVFSDGRSNSSTVEALVDEAWQAAGQAQTKDEIQHTKDIQADKDAGKKYSEQADKELKISTNKEMLARVQRVGNEMAEIANKTPIVALWGDKHFSKFDYTFHLVADKDVNAFSLPGGYIYVNEGLVNYVQSDDELAGVLAHEISHASMRHVATLQHEMSKLNAVTLPLILISIMAGAGGEAIPAIELGSTAKGNGWSVQAEQAADFGGFQYMIKSNYDPTGMLTVMERLAKDERSQPAIDYGIFQTHPPSRDRADALKKEMSDAGIPIRRSKVSTSCRATSKDLGSGQMEILFGGKHIVTIAGQDSKSRSDQIVQRLNDFFDSTPELYDIESGSSNSILGLRQTLITITPQDAEAEKKTADQMKAETIKNLQGAVYNLAYKIWDAR